MKYNSLDLPHYTEYVEQECYFLHTQVRQDHSLATSSIMNSGNMELVCIPFILKL